MEKVAILSFYSFVNVSDLEMLQSQLLYHCKRKMIKGTILIAPEGFNATICGDYDNVSFVLDKIKDLTGAIDVMSKFNYSDVMPFSRMKVKIKKEIISMGVGYLDVEKLKGDYISTKEWDEFISRDDVVLVDTRNDYEIEFGTFDGAVDPETKTFREFPKWVEDNKALLKDKKIAMCCTGGVRCEKSTAYMKSIGYDDVYHLEGGILQYLEDTKNENGKWKGECFVFDDRIAVDDDLTGLMLERPDRNYKN